MTINEKQDEIIEEFDLFDDQLDKTQYIIDLGKKLPPMPEAYKTDQNRIMGCQSKVWVDAELKEDNRTGARPVIGDDLLAEQFREFLSDDAADMVCRLPGRPRDDHA